MTKKEAIVLIEATQKMIPFSDLHEALDIAIEALQKQVPMKPNTNNGLTDKVRCGAIMDEVKTDV